MSVPRFSFHLYVSVGDGREQLLPTIQAETFDIKDGALIFYQIITLDGKPVKAPVLSYASGAWLRVALLGKDGADYVASSS